MAGEMSGVDRPGGDVRGTDPNPDLAPNRDPIRMVRRLAECWEHGDADAAAALFAPDAVYEEPPAFVLAGRAAIHAFFADFAARHHDVAFEVVRALAREGEGLAAAEWRFAHTRTADGERKVYAGLAWVELDAAGLVARWRGFSARVE
jgi:uncharacterized protein (TIGR02246 family)